MINVRLEILFELGNSSDNNSVPPTVYSLEVNDGATVGEVIKKLALENDAFPESIYNREAARLNEQVAIVLNDRLLESLNGLETIMKHGDVIKLMPVISGG